MPGMNLRQFKFTYDACGLFTKKKKIRKFKETSNSRNIYQIELEKTCFQHDIASGDLKYLSRRTV